MDTGGKDRAGKGDRIADRMAWDMGAAAYDLMSDVDDLVIVDERVMSLSCGPKKGDFSVSKQTPR